MGMDVFERVELFVWALAQLATYGLAGLAAIALLTRPREATGLLLGERGLRAAVRLLGPTGAAVERSNVGESAIRLVASVRSLADSIAERLLGSRDPAATAAVWSATEADAPGDAKDGGNTGDTDDGQPAGG